MTVLAGLLLACAATSQASTLRPEQDAASSLEEARTAMQRGELDRAELLLERVLMLQPENAEARVELALLMVRRGQADAAQGLLRGLIDDPRTPSEHRARLATLLAGLPRLERPAASPHTARPEPHAISGPLEGAVVGAERSSTVPIWRAETSLSWSSNPLARTALTDITFTTPDGPVQVPLTSRPQHAVLSGLGLARLGGNFGFELHLQDARIAGARPAARLSAWGPLALQSPSLSARSQAAASSGSGEAWWDALQWSLQAQQGLDGARKTMIGLSILRGRWRWSLQHYEDQSLEDRGGLFRVDLQSSAGAKFQWSAYAEHSTSMTRSQAAVRAGGQAQWALADGWRAQFLWQAQQDLQGYNPLLAEGAPRKLRTTQVAVERTIPLSAEKLLSIRALTTQRQSNIELFAFREAALHVSLFRVWR